MMSDKFERGAVVVEAALHNCPCDQGPHPDSTPFAALAEMRDQYRKVMNAVLIAHGALARLEYDPTLDRKGERECIQDALEWLRRVDV